MSIIEFFFAMILIWMAIDMVCIGISIVSTKRLTKDLDQKTWERIEGRRK